MITLMNLPIRRGNAPLRIARGHFATNHSHINYYVDMTYQKKKWMIWLMNTNQCKHLLNLRTEALKW